MNRVETSRAKGIDNKLPGGRNCTCLYVSPACSIWPDRGRNLISIDYMNEGLLCVRKIVSSNKSGLTTVCVKNKDEMRKAV